jgi:S-adenosylmethionine decarboxylase proenzyme
MSLREKMKSRKQSSPSTAVGQHLLADLYQIDPIRIQDHQGLVSLLTDALKAAGFSILATNSHKFHEGGCGVTAMALLSESHATIHSYPERQYLALDIFSCGAQDPHDVLHAIVESLQPGDCVCSVHSRGGRQNE